MSTVSLTIIAAVIGITWFVAGAFYSLWHRQLAHALAQLGAVALFAHLSLTSLAWAGAAQRGNWEQPSIPEGLRMLAEPASMLPTWFFDIPAWAAIILMLSSMAVDTVQQYRDGKEDVIDE